MNQFHWELIVKASGILWPGIIALAGVLIGANIADRNQRKQWIANNKKREYQELTSAITHGFSAMLKCAALVAHGPEQQREFAAAEEQVLITITDRIFIEDEIRRMKILERWQALSVNLANKRDTLAFSNAVGDIKANLVYEARRLMK